MNAWWQEWKKPQVCITLAGLLFAGGGAWMRLDNLADGQAELKTEVLDKLDGMDDRLRALENTTNQGDKEVTKIDGDLQRLRERIQILERFTETQTVYNTDMLRDLARLEVRP